MAAKAGASGRQGRQPLHGQPHLGARRSVGRLPLHHTLEDLEAFEEAFPEIEVTDDIYEIDRNRITCSGGTASLDLMLHVVGMTHGQELAGKVSEQFIHDRIRDAHDHQRMALQSRVGVSDPKLLAAIAEMETNLEEPLALPKIAVSRWPFNPSIGAAV